MNSKNYHTILHRKIRNELSGSCIQRTDCLRITVCRTVISAKSRECLD